MKTFDEIYEELQNTDNKELNSVWQKAKKESNKSKKLIVAICVLIDVYMLYKTICITSPTFLVFVLVRMLVINLSVVVVVNKLFSRNKNKYNQEYKKTVITKLISNFYDNLGYFPEKTMPEYIYQEPKYEKYDRYKSEDYFEAQIDNEYYFQMAELLTQDEEKYIGTDGKTHTRTITKFHGLFAKIVMHKSIKGELRVMQNGGLLFSKKLKMDSSEFEKHFDVKASDPIVGMQLLTADVMEELVEYENKTKMKFDIFIKENELYLRFHSGAMFETGNLKNGVLDRNLIQKYFYMLNFTYNLSRKLINVVNDAQI